MLEEFYHIFRDYANDILSLMQEHTVSEVKRVLREQGLTEVSSNDDAYKRVFGKVWRHFLKHSRSWGKNLLDKEVVRILKGMAGLVADLESDSDSDSDHDDDDDDSDPLAEDTTSASELSVYRDTLATYLEYARWSLMHSLTNSDTDPVDDIPVVPVSDFVCYFIDELTRQRSIKKNLFLGYDELNQAAVIKPCILTSVRRTIPQSVYQALLAARLQFSRTRRGRGSNLSTRPPPSSRRSRTPLVRASDQFGSDMMSSRAVAARINTNQLRNTMSSSASTVCVPTTLPAVDSNPTVVEEPVGTEEKDTAKDEEKGESDEGGEEETEKAVLKGTTDAILDEPNDVRRVDLDSMHTMDYRSSSSSSASSAPAKASLNKGHLRNIVDNRANADIETGVPTFR